MIIAYTVETFVIELLLNQYKNSDPEFIKQKANDELDTFLSIGQIRDYLNHTEDYEHISSSVAMNEIFD